MNSGQFLRNFASSVSNPIFLLTSRKDLMIQLLQQYTTLLMMVSAFGGYDLIMEAYKKAIKEKYKFYSYGDAMLIL